MICGVRDEDIALKERPQPSQGTLVGSMRFAAAPAEEATGLNACHFAEVDEFDDFSFGRKKKGDRNSDASIEVIRDCLRLRRRLLADDLPRSFE